MDRTDGRKPCDLLVTNGRIVTVDEDRTVHDEGTLAIENGKIVAVGGADLAAQFDPREKIDAGGGVVHPGFVESHVHVSLQVGRGAIRDDMPWAEQPEFFTNFWNALDDHDEYTGSLLGCLEMVRNGSTYFLEAGSVLEPDTAAAAATDIGIRGSLADPFLWDVGGFSADAPHVKRAPADPGRVFKVLGDQLSRNQDPDALVRGHVAVVGMGACSDELELAAKSCADENGALLARHQSFSPGDVESDDERFGAHPLVHYAEIGVLGPNTIVAHLNFIRDDEVTPALESGMSIAWCPSASMLFGNGGTFHGRHFELYERGLNVSLGSDAINSSLSFDLGTQGFLAALTAREKTLNRGALVAENIFEMLTIGGARAVGEAERLGSLEVGKCADLVIRRTDLPEAQPNLDPIQSIVFGSFGKSVDTVIVNGRVIVRGGHSTQVDELKVYADARASSRVVFDRMNWPIDSDWRHVQPSSGLPG